jgi:hypothetical protein
MGSALNSVMGGSGGGLLGAVGGIVGGIFGGPIGAMIGQAIGNMLQEAIGNAMQQATDKLQKEDGMPKFLADLVNQKVGEALNGLKNHGVDPSVQEHAEQQYGDAFKDFADQLAQQIIDSVREQMKKGQESTDSDGNKKTTGSKGGKASAESWLTAIAKAMGQVMGDKARKLVDLSDRIANTNPKGNSSEAKQEAAAQMQKLNAEFQATSQEFNLLQNTFSTSIKTIGEAMASVARKQ